MAAEDIHAQVLGWALDETGKQAFGEDFGVAVAFGMAMMQTPAGPAQMWSLFITARNPILGEGPLYHGPVPVGSPRPVEAEVRKQVGEGIRMLRDLGKRKLAGNNGRPAGVPG